MTPATRRRADDLVDALRSEGDPEVRRELAERYGIRTDRAVGIPMRRMKEIARPHGGDHELALALWATGLYEARTIAAFVDDPALVDMAQMNAWCSDFDNWAIVDTVCFHLFDRAPGAWSRVEPWVDDEAEFTRRAGFALLWALALHDRSAPDDVFRDALRFVERHAADPRPLVTKAQTMALRAIGTKRPEVRADVLDLAHRLESSTDAPARRIGRPITTALG